MVVVTDADLGEVWPVCEKIKHIMQYGEDYLKTEPRGTSFFVHKKAYVEYLPYGVIGIICPFNFPFHNIYCPLVPVRPLFLPLFFGGGAYVLPCRFCLLATVLY